MPWNAGALVPSTAPLGERRLTPRPADGRESAFLPASDEVNNSAVKAIDSTLREGPNHVYRYKTEETFRPAQDRLPPLASFWHIDALFPDRTCRRGSRDFESVSPAATHFWNFCPEGF